MSKSSKPTDRPASEPASDLPAGEMQFFDGFEPGIHAGTYRIDLTQSVSAPDATVAPVSQLFVVRGPHFVLDPSDVHTRFPPPGATGHFTEVLPHIVFNKRLLPWEREVPGFGATVPWLALVVFGDGELMGPAAGGDHAETLTVKQLLAPDPHGAVRKPVLPHGSVSPDEEDLRCQAITLSSTLFAQILATSRELPYLAHARQVATGSKPSFDHKDDGWFSVIVANRFPRPGTTAVASKSVVHLVSLEGFGDLLSGDAPSAPSQPRVQLASLHSWTFSCLADRSQTFAGLAQNLAFDDAGARRPASSQLLRLPVTTSGATEAMAVAVAQRLDDGYVALGYHAPSGEDGFAWYRGPLAPSVPHPAPDDRVLHTADAARIYDPATGVFDLGLAAAWQIGRSLALASESYATALMRVRLAANAALERHGATPADEVHWQFAALMADGGARQIHAASVAGDLALPAAPPAPPAPLSRQSPADARRAMLADPQLRSDLAAQLDDNPDAVAVAGWLAGLFLLRGVPFVHLVPDARMLPVESIRFFYLDHGWLGALLDGALSIGLGTSREAAVQQALTGKLIAMARAAALSWRATRRGDPVPAAPSGPTAGFVLRSALASGWPGLGVAGSHQGAPVPLLRLEHLGPGVLFCLFNGVPDQVVLSEPHEGLEFGVDDLGRIDTRHIDPPRITPGTAIEIYRPDQPDAPSPAIRPGGQRVLNLASRAPSRSYPPESSGPPADLIELLARALDVAPSALGPADVAVQMVKGPETLTFSLAPSGKAAGRS